MIDKQEPSDLMLTIVLPTYNESANIQPILSAIHKAMKSSGVEYEVLFVDDSNDSTPEIIRSEMSHDGRVRIAHREKNDRTGLATAFVLGFDLAGGKYICCLDSDLQHPPETIPDLVKEALSHKETDVVVATRYALGGSAAGLGSLFTAYGIYRRLVSIFMKYLTQIVFVNARKTSDPLGGFFLFRKNIVYGVDFEPRGFKILVEILMRARYGEVREVPYRFLPRENDESKADLKQGWQFLRHMLHIARTVPEADRFLKFCLIGFNGVLINLGMLVVAVEIFSLSLPISYIIAAEVSVISNCLLNVFFTYGDTHLPDHHGSVRKVMNYYFISAVLMIFGVFAFDAIVNAGLQYILSALLVSILVVFANFFITTKIVWRRDIL
ncbi:MAG: glycosyltransferase [Candidatus Moraniibacteriota bacterium]|nr:MAG: glycosyltransferase [Candidatus Moranbacteria bacterium]